MSVKVYDEILENNLSCILCPLNEPQHKERPNKRLPNCPLCCGKPVTNEITRRLDQTIIKNQTIDEKNKHNNNADSQNNIGIQGTNDTQNNIPDLVAEIPESRNLPVTWHLLSCPGRSKHQLLLRGGTMHVLCPLVLVCVARTFLLLVSSSFLGLMI